jgi:ABC-type multidrug transport system fused ATPase/permease subunit
VQAIAIWQTWLIAQILNHLIQASYQNALETVGILSLSVICRMTLSHISEMNNLKNLSYNIQQFLEEYSLKNIFNLNISQYTEDHSAVKMEVINRGENATEQIINTYVLNLIPTATQIIFSLLAISYYSPLISLLTLVTLSMTIYWTNSFSKWHRPLVRKNIDNWDEQRKVRTEAFQNLTLIKNNGTEDFYLDKYLENRQSYIAYAIDTFTYRFNHDTKRWGFLMASRIASMVLIILQISKGALAVGNIYAIWSWLGDVYSNIFNIVQAMRQLPIQYVELEKYLKIIDKQPDFVEKGKLNFKAGNITFTDLSFEYPKFDKPALKNLNLTIPQGKKVAFVGVSGSGKSTIIKLLLRMYDYNQGSIKIGSEELKDINASNLRHHIGYVEQHVDLFDTSIRENIIFDLADKKASDEELKDVLEKARIDQFYHRLDKGLDTLIGERGVKLSGGERQRIGIERALIKNPEILIFDEATASLDTENEKYIQEAIDEASRGRTSIIIAHRLSTVQNADVIFVMHLGELVGTGTHVELLQNNSYYQNLIKHQA